MFATIMTVFVPLAVDEMQQPGGQEPDLKNQAEDRYRFPPSEFHGYCHCLTDTGSMFTTHCL